MLMCFISVCAHAQLILLEEDESGIVETVQQAVTPQVQSVATPAPQPAPQQQQIVAEEEEENLFAPKQQAQPAKSSKAKAEPKPKAEKAPKQKAEKAPKAEPAQQPKKQQGLVMEEEEDEAAKAKAEAERKAAEEAARVEAERKAAEEAARVEAERKAAEEAARVEAERKAAEAAAAAEAARLEAERKAAEEAAAAEAARQEAERLAAEEAAKAEAERLAAEEAAKAAVVVPVVAPVLVEEEQAAPQSSEALKAAEMQAKLDSVLRVQREQEEQLRRLQEQKQAVQTERDREDAALMERARQEAEARAKAKAEAERRAQLEEERRFNDQQVVANEEPKDKKKETIFTRYYKHNGQNMLSFLSFGYSTLFVLDGNLANNSADMVFKRHMLSFEAFEWRAKCFGMQLFNFEMGLNTEQNFNGPLYGGANANLQTQTIVNDIQPADAKTMWFAYKPAIKFYIPCTKWMAVELYGGMEVDLCAVWSKINQSYYPVNSLIPAQNFFLSGFGGLGLMFTPTPYVPMELKAEYRHPVKGNTAIVPQGVYLSLQIHLATPTKKR